MQKFVDKLDFFARPPTLYYRGKAHLATRGGFALSITVVALVLLFTTYELATYADVRVSSHTDEETGPDY